MSRKSKSNRRKNRAARGRTTRHEGTGETVITKTEDVTTVSGDEAIVDDHVTVEDQHDGDGQEEDAKDGKPLIDVEDLEDDGSADVGEDGLDDETYDDMRDVLVSNDGDGVIRSTTDLADSLITYETDGFIDPKTGRPYNRFHLMSHPVKIVFRQHVQGDDPDEYETVGFVVNRAFAYEMGRLFDNIRRAYDGQPLDRKGKARERLSVEGAKKKAIRLIRDHPVQSVMTVVLVIAVIVILVFM